jgi:hypothetical protein
MKLGILLGYSGKQINFPMDFIRQANPATIQRSVPAEQRNLGKKFFRLYAVCFS